MTWTVSSDEIICSAMKDATDCHAIEPEENQAKKKLLSFHQWSNTKPNLMTIIFYT